MKMAISFGSGPMGGRYIMSLAYGENIQQFIFDTAGIVTECKGSLGNFQRNHQINDTAFDERIRDAVASVGIELMRQKLNGEPA
jgi:hypothetical protein